MAAIVVAVSMPRLCIAQNADDTTPAEKTIHLPAAVPQALKPVPGPAPAAAPVAVADVALSMDERGIRTAGISTVPIERERRGTDLFLPGTIAIPQQQIRVVAAPAGGLVESMTLAADEPAQAGQAIALLRSPAIVEAQREFLAALSDEALAEDRLKRTQLLFDGKATPERELRVAQSQAVQAKARLDERTQILLLMDLTDVDVETLRTSRKIFAGVTVYSPIAGTVVKRHTSPGERVEAAAPLYTIAELEPLWVNIQVPASRLANILPGAPVMLPAYSANGHVIRIGRTVDPATQSATVVAEIGSNGGSVRPGLAVDVTVHIADGEGAQWSVPAASVVRHRERSWVFLRSANGFRARPVQVVAESARAASIRGQFADTDQVAVRGILSLLSALAEADKD
jgi:multidrug efflux pump subunit AcrA (membrane-fusion protein)